MSEVDLKEKRTRGACRHGVADLASELGMSVEKPTTETTASEGEEPETETKAG